MTDLVLLAVGAVVLATVALLASSGSVGPVRSRHARAASVTARALAPAAAIVPVALLLSVWRPPTTVVVVALVAWLLTLVWVPRTSRWSAAAHASWSLTVVAGLAYVLAMAAWTVGSGLDGFSLVGAWVLWALELVAYALVLSYGWEIHDALGSRVWARRLPVGGAVASRASAELPFVSIHVPAHNEPPDMVVETLTALLALDHPAYEVLVIDNNTEDDALCAPVEAFCAEHPDVLRFHRLLDWPGFKSGALNHAEKHSDPRATLIAVVDADYQVDPSWLRELVGAFDDPQVGFVQSPQDYRGWQSSQYLRSLFYSYDYFFTVSQPSRDERNAAIFGGTMGIVRRSALLDVGGWDEWCVTEDAELSLRLLQHGWSGHHVDTSYGHGIMPLTFEALKRQRFRWCFGGMQILKRHWRTLLPWSRGTAMTTTQRMAYLVGGFQWLGDLVGIVFSLVVMASLLDLALGGGLVVRRLSGLLLVAVPALVALGLVRAVAVLKAVGPGVTWRDALGAFLMWLSLGWVVALACVRGLVEPRGVFLRTPKVRGDVRWSDAIRANLTEVALVCAAAACAAAALVRDPGWVSVGLGLLLLVPVIGWAAAPVHSIAALRADLPADLRRRRAGEWMRGLGSSRARWSAASLVGVGAVAAVVLAVVQPTSSEAPRTTVLPRVQQPSPTKVPTRTVPTPSTTAPTGRPTATDTGPGSSPSSTAGTPPGTSTGSRPAPSSSTSVSSTAPPTTGPTTLPTQAPVTTVPSPTARPTSTNSPTTRPTQARTPTTPPGRPTTTGRP